MPPSQSMGPGQSQIGSQGPYDGRQTHMSPPGYSEDILDSNFMRPFPEIIDVVRIQSFSEVKGIWRQGISTLEEVFADYIVKINEEFMRKCEEFERVRRQLLSNHEWLLQYYEEMRRRLDMKRIEIHAERETWR